MSACGCGCDGGGGSGRGAGGTSRSKRDCQLVIQPSRSSGCLAEGQVGIGTITLLSGLVVPFNVAYTQIAMAFIVQGSVMRNFGIIDAPMMNNADAVSVLAFRYLIRNVLYPELNRRGIKIPTMYKFTIGSRFGAWAVGCVIVMDYRIHHVYHKTGEAVTVLWQVFPYLLIGIGEIFAVSATYELAFTVAPARMKSIVSAANLSVHTPVQRLQLVVPQCQWQGRDTQIARLRELDGRQLLLGRGGDIAPWHADQRPALRDELVRLLVT